MIDTPERAVEYWYANIPNADWFDPAKEAFIVLVLNARKRILGHNLVAIGSLDTVSVAPREVFRPILAIAGHAAVLAHNLCVAAHKQCYVALPVMCSVRFVGLAILRHSARREGHGFA
jgi:hypothetical protein